MGQTSYASLAVSNATPSPPQPPTSFVPASKLVCVTSTVGEQDKLTPSSTGTSRAAPDGAEMLQKVEEKSAEPTFSSTKVVDEPSYPSTSYDGGASRLKRVKVDPNDLYVELSSSSDEELIPIPPVSGPGFGFQLASSLSISSAAAWPHSTSEARPSVASSVRPAENGGPGVQRKFASTGRAKPLPKITNFFEK